MAEKKVIKGRGIARKLIEEQNEKMRRLLIKLEAEEAKRAAADAEREQKEIRAAVEEAKEFPGQPGAGGNFIHHTAAPCRIARKRERPGP